MKVQIDVQTDARTDGNTVKVDFKSFFCLFLGKGGEVAATPWLLWSALKIEVCFSILKINHYPVEGG